MEKQKVKIGLLPFYLKLYDDLQPEHRGRIELFYTTISGMLQKQGFEVLTSEICRIEPEFRQAVRRFESEQAAAIVTLHMAYSPSLESAEVLASTPLPLIVFDTTPTADFSPAQDPGELMYNHGIHGVQDMCNLLLRNGKPFFITAGHWEDPETVRELVRNIEAAGMATALRTARIGLIGEPFAGMGDFAIPAPELKRAIGMDIVSLETDEWDRYRKAVSQDDIETELKLDRERFDCSAVSGETLGRSIALGLAVRRWMDENRLTGFTFNFRDITAAAGFETVPFLEAGKQMALGRGYAGEGDCLTAAVISAVGSVYPETGFTEMFCPDWKGNSIFLSHMGEINYKLVSGKPAGKPVVKEMDYAFSETGNPAFIPGRFKEGSIVLFDLAPTREGYRLILAPAEMIGDDDDREDRFTSTVRGWFRPALAGAGNPVGNFLAEYSRAGGTHHLGLSYTASIDVLTAFAQIMGWDVVIIG
jgi:L-arabinose isomerase